MRALTSALFAGAGTCRAGSPAGAAGAAGAGAGRATAGGSTAGRSAATRCGAGICAAVAAPKDKHERRGRQHHPGAVGRNFHL